VLRQPTAAALLAACLISTLAAAADPLATARAHLKEGKFDLIIDDLADTSKMEKPATAQVFADAGEMALEKSDRSFARLCCERAIALDPKKAKALRTCTTAAIQDKQFDEAERFGDALGALSPKDGAVALLRAQAAQGRESWQMVVALLEAFESDKAVGKQVAPLLAEARANLKKGAPAPAAQSEEERVENAIKAARDLDRKASIEDPAAEAARKKKWRPMGEKVVLYTKTQCNSCDQVRAWLQQNEVEFEELDSDKSSQGLREALKICGKARQVQCYVPITVVNGEVVSGFDVVRLKQVLNL